LVSSGEAAYTPIGRANSRAGRFKQAKQNQIIVDVNGVGAAKVWTKTAGAAAQEKRTGVLKPGTAKLVEEALTAANAKFSAGEEITMDVLQKFSALFNPPLDEFEIVERLITSKEAECVKKEGKDTLVNNWSTLSWKDTPKGDFAQVVLGPVALQALGKVAATSRYEDYKKTATADRETVKGKSQWLIDKATDDYWYKWNPPHPRKPELNEKYRPEDKDPVRAESIVDRLWGFVIQDLFELDLKESKPGEVNDGVNVKNATNAEIRARGPVLFAFLRENQGKRLDQKNKNLLPTDVNSFTEFLEILEAKPFLKFLLADAVLDGGFSETERRRIGELMWEEKKKRIQAGEHSEVQESWCTDKDKTVEHFNEQATALTKGVTDFFMDMVMVDYYRKEALDILDPKKDGSHLEISGAQLDALAPSCLNYSNADAVELTGLATDLRRREVRKALVGCGEAVHQDQKKWKDYLKKEPKEKAYSKDMLEGAAPRLTWTHSAKETATEACKVLKPWMVQALENCGFGIIQAGRKADEQIGYLAQMLGMPFQMLRDDLLDTGEAKGTKGVVENYRQGDTQYRDEEINVLVWTKAAEAKETSKGKLLTRLVASKYGPEMQVADKMKGPFPPVLRAHILELADLYKMTPSAIRAALLSSGEAIERPQDKDKATKANHANPSTLKWTKLAVDSAEKPPQSLKHFRGWKVLEKLRGVQANSMVTAKQIEILANMGLLHKGSDDDLNEQLNEVARNTDDTTKARALVAAGADLSSTNGEPFWHTPLHQAAYHGRYEMAKTLVDLGAKLDLHSNPCDRGPTGIPLELARGGGHEKIADMLEKVASEKAQSGGLTAKQIESLVERSPLVKGKELHKAGTYHLWTEAAAQAVRESCRMTDGFNLLHGVPKLLARYRIQPEQLEALARLHNLTVNDVVDKLEASGEMSWDGTEMLKKLRDDSAARVTLVRDAGDQDIYRVGDVVRVPRVPLSQAEADKNDDLIPEGTLGEIRKVVEDGGAWVKFQGIKGQAFDKYVLHKRHQVYVRMDLVQRVDFMSDAFVFQPGDLLQVKTTTDDGVWTDSVDRRKLPKGAVGEVIEKTDNGDFTFKFCGKSEVIYKYSFDKLRKYPSKDYIDPEPDRKRDRQVRAIKWNEPKCNESTAAAMEQFLTTLPETDKAKEKKNIEGIVVVRVVDDQLYMKTAFKEIPYGNRGALKNEDWDEMKYKSFLGKTFEVDTEDSPDGWVVLKIPGGDPLPMPVDCVYKDEEATKEAKDVKMKPAELVTGDSAAGQTTVDGMAGSKESQFEEEMPDLLVTELDFTTEGHDGVAYEAAAQGQATWRGCQGMEPKCIIS